MGFIPFAAFVIGLIEALLVFGLFWVPFRVFKASPTVRNWAVYVASYPGAFAAASGWVGFVVPIPALIGAPLVLLTGQLDGAGNAAWYPAPFMNYAVGFQGPTNVVFAFVAGELALLISWIVVVRLIRTRLGAR